MTTFQSNNISIYGEKGTVWLSELPDLVVEISSRLNLSDLKEVTNLTYNYVLSGFHGDKPIILKLGLDNAGLKQEAFALRCFVGCGAVKVISENNGMLLLERAVPGTSLKNYFLDQEMKSIEITCSIIKKLHQANIPKSDNLPHIKDWLSALDNDLNIPHEYLAKARRLRDTLLKTSVPDVFLHGDLHHDNILQNGNDWVVIDPKGIIGEAAYEVAAFIRNPMPELLSVNNAEEIIQNRISTFSNLLDIKSARILDWCFVQAVLAWTWSREDGCDNGYWKRLVEIFHSCNISL